MDEAAWVRDLSAGEAATWPLYAPHRVENLDEFNLSLEIEFRTWESRVTGGAHFFNGLLRRYGLPPIGGWVQPSRRPARRDVQREASPRPPIKGGTDWS